jgi:hypothetical protein
MTITFASTNLTPSVLEGAEGLSVAGQNQAQVAPLFRATAASIFGRGNAVTSISFTVQRIHADADTASAHVVGHFAALPKTGTLQLGSTNYAGAVLVGCTSSQKGLTSVNVYQFTAGLPS